MRGVFLDRDGVIIRKAREGEYICSVKEVEFLPGSPEAIAELSRSGYKVIIVTNQRGVATGKIQLADLTRIHTRITETVATLGGELSDILYCPHDISDQCPCRKPKPGMLVGAAEKHHLSLPDCWMVGDSRSDIIAGKSAGCRTVFITQATQAYQCTEQPDLCTQSLSSAAKLVLTYAGLA